MPPLRIYTDRSLIPDGHPPVTMLAPFWGGFTEHPADPVAGRYEPYAARARELFTLSPLDEADFAVVPAAWEHIGGDRRAQEACTRFAERVTQAGKQLLVFFVSDSAAPVDLPGATVLRTSLLRSRQRPNELAMPAFSDDVAGRVSNSQLQRPAAERPMIGFCGYAPKPPKWRRPAPSAIRWRVCRTLSRDPSIETDFVIRHAFWAGLVGEGQPDYAAMSRAREEYVANLMRTDYQVCARGGGNFSYRLYETMSAARIPLFVDTDSVLPFEREIGWRDLMPFVDGDDPGSAGRVLAEFHRSRSAAEIQACREGCRTTWRRYLSPLGFFENLARLVFP